MTIDQRIRQAIEAGVAHHHAGRLEQAEALYRQVLTQLPYQADALHLLGLIFYQRGDLEQAAQLVAQAVQYSPTTADMRANLGLIYHTMNRLPEAEAAL